VLRARRRRSVLRGITAVSKVRSPAVKTNEIPELQASLRGLCESRAIGGRRLSTALLLWFLEHVERLDSVEADDAVIDLASDLEIDGLWVDDLSEQVTLLEGKWVDDVAPLGRSDLGDVQRAIRGLATPAGLARLTASQLQPELQGLLERQNLGLLLNAGYDVRYVIVTNGLVSPSDRLALEACAEPVKGFETLYARI
jgi:hypothetical protein